MPQSDVTRFVFTIKRKSVALMADGSSGFEPLPRLALRCGLLSDPASVAQNATES
jgi:hypothetical protein